jgi:prepilin-type N-terminal cleavage/methylation domain-containing protein
MKKFTKYSRGFTLIELLVVIAIIGILSAIVLASLSTARSKGKDAAVEEQMSGSRAQAEIFAASSSNSYAPSSGPNACAATTGQGGIYNILVGAASSSGAANFSVIGSAVANTGSGNLGSCYAVSTAWVAMMPLSTAHNYWCADSSGNSKLETSDPATALSSFSPVQCP